MKHGHRLLDANKSYMQIDRTKVVLTFSTPFHGIRIPIHKQSCFIWYLIPDPVPFLLRIISQIVYLSSNEAIPWPVCWHKIVIVDCSIITKSQGCITDLTGDWPPDAIDSSLFPLIVVLCFKARVDLLDDPYSPVFIMQIGCDLFCGKMPLNM